MTLDHTNASNPIQFNIIIIIIVDHNKLHDTTIRIVESVERDWDQANNTQEMKMCPGGSSLGQVANVGTLDQ